MNHHTRKKNCRNCDVIYCYDCHNICPYCCKKCNSKACKCQGKIGATGLTGATGLRCDPGSNGENGYHLLKNQV